MTCRSIVHRALPAFAAIALILLLLDAARSAATLPTVTLTINGQKIVAEVASSPQDRATGLMNRFSLQTDHGMLFVFERPEPLGFWMKNTFIPLSIAFLDASGRILNIEDMAPQTENTHWSRGPGPLCTGNAQGVVCRTRNPGGGPRGGRGQTCRNRFAAPSTLALTAPGCSIASVATDHRADWSACHADCTDCRGTSAPPCWEEKKNASANRARQAEYPGIR